MKKQDYQKAIHHFYESISSWNDNPELILHRWIRVALIGLELENGMLSNKVIETRLGWYKKAFEWALEKGMDLNQQDEEGLTFLHFICLNNQKIQSFVLDWIFEKEVNPYLKDKKGKIPLDYLPNFYTEMIQKIKDYSEKWTIKKEQEELNQKLNQSLVVNKSKSFL